MAAFLALLAPPAGAQTCGDADGDGTVTAADGRRILAAAAALPVACAVDQCDTDGDGALTDLDGVRLLRTLAALPPALICPTPGARRTMLQGVAGVVVVPAYRTLHAAAEELRAASAALHAGPTPATLASARTAWRAAHEAWKVAEAFRLGPSERLRTAARIDWFPIRPGRIEGEIAGAASFGDAYVDTLGSNLVGMHALEYLLFDPAGGDAAVLAALTGGARRRDYLLALAINLAARTGELLAAWEPGQGNFGAALAASGATATAFPTLKAAVDELINRMIFSAEVLEEVGLGDPLGIGGSGAPDPSRLESWRSRHALADAHATLEGLRSVYLGIYQGFSGAGVGNVTAPLSAAVDARVRMLLDAARATLARIPPPLETALADRPDLVGDAYRAVQDLRRALVLDLAPVLGVTLTFGGTDGD